jgi:type II secretory pathway component PulL
MVRSVTLAIALLFSPAALAQNQVGSHTQKEDDACDRDAHRFCKELIPDQFRVLTCLQQNRPKLSKACRVVLQSHGV